MTVYYNEHNNNNMQTRLLHKDTVCRHELTTLITACTVVQAVVKANRKSHGKIACFVITCNNISGVFDFWLLGAL